jgi:uncharacterized membrane protein YhaH (DUF805 family)
MRTFLPHVTFDPARLGRSLGWLMALLFHFEGRTGRRDFWAGSAVVAGLLLIIERVLFRHMPLHTPLAMTLIGAAALYPFAALATKRGRHRGHGENWGVVVLLLALACGMLARSLSGTAWALPASTASVALWLFTLVDLGLMPAPGPEHIRVRQVGVAPKR